MVTIPICPPWDNASKNRAYNIALHIKRHHIHLLTRSASLLPRITENIVCEDIYKTRATIFHKLLLGFRLLKRDPHVTAYHFFFQPSLASATLIRWLLKIKRKAAIQTVLNVFKAQENLDRYIFGDLVLVSSTFMQQRLHEWGCSNVRKINPGVDCDLFSKRRVGTDVRKQLNIRGEPVVLYAGEYTEDRGIRHLLAAVKQVVTVLPSAKFIFACRVFNRKDIFREEQLRAMSENMGVAGSIIFLQTFDDMPSLLKSVNITIFPTINMYDKMDIPMTLLESLAMERPVIVSDVPPLNEIMQADVGVKVRPGDQTGLAEAIIELLSNVKKQKEMGQRGREMVVQHFNIKKIAAIYDEIYSNEGLHALST